MEATNVVITSPGNRAIKMYTP